MARNRAPEAERAAKGSDVSHRPEPKKLEDKTPPSSGIAPKWLKGAMAKAIWEQVQKDTSSIGLIKKLDGNALARYCRYMGDWVDIDRKLKALGNVVYETDTKHGKMQRIHPLFLARDRTESNLIKLEEQLGLTPRSRMAIIAHLAGQPPLLPGLEDNDAPHSRDEDDSIGFLGGSTRPN